MGTNAGSGSQPPLTLSEQYLNFLKRNSKNNFDGIEQGYQDLREYILEKTKGDFKDTIVVSLNKTNLSLNYMWPGYIGNSPYDSNDDIGVLLHSDKFLKRSSIQHFYSMRKFKSLSEIDYKYEKLEILGENYDLWAQQIQNNLENIYFNSNLQFIGGYTEPDNHNIFNFVMYKMSKISKKALKFDLVVDTIYGDITPDSLKIYLSEKFKETKLILRGILPVYINDESSMSRDESHTIMHFMIFQSLSVNYTRVSTYAFEVVKFPDAKQDGNYENVLLDFIEEYGAVNDSELLGIAPKLHSTDSLLVFTNVL